MADLTMPADPARSLGTLLLGAGTAMWQGSHERGEASADDVRAMVADAWAKLSQTEQVELAAWATRNRGALLRMAAGYVMGAR